VARNVCRRMTKQIDLALGSLPSEGGTLPFREAADAIAAERTRLTAVLDHAAQEAGVHFQAALAHAVSSQDPNLWSPPQQPRQPTQ
jgi:hypothetical protein